MQLLTRLIFTLFMAVAVVAAAPAYAQIEEDLSVYDEVDEPLTFHVAKGEVETWKDVSKDIDNTLSITVMPHKGDELYEISRLNAGEWVTLYISDRRAADFQIIETIGNSEIILKLDSAADMERVIDLLPGERANGAVKIKVLKE